jgi:hypothetical protein
MTRHPMVKRDEALGHPRSAHGSDSDTRECTGVSDSDTPAAGSDARSGSLQLEKTKSP